MQILFYDREIWLRFWEKSKWLPPDITLGSFFCDILRARQLLVTKLALAFSEWRSEYDICPGMWLVGCSKWDSEQVGGI